MTTNDLLLKLQTEKETAINFQKRRHAAWLEIYQMFRDIIETNELTQRQAVNVPLMKETTKTLMSKIDEPPDIIFECKAQGDKARQAEVYIKEIWAEDADRCNFEGIDVLEKKNVILFARTFKKMNFVNEVFAVNVLENLDIVVDPLMNPLDIETARYYVHLHIFKPLRDILASDKYSDEGKSALKNAISKNITDAKGVFIKFPENATDIAKQAIINSLNIQNYDDLCGANIMVELNEHGTEVWDEKKKKFVRHTCVVGADAAILYDKTQEETIGVDFWPLVTWSDDVDNKDIWNDGIGDLIRVPNKIINIFYSTMAENRVYRNLGMSWFLPAPGFDPNTFEPEPFGMYPAPRVVDDSGRVLTINEVVKQMDIPALEDNLVSIDFLIKLVERACYSEDTETLTENGWKYYWEVQDNEKIATFNPKTKKVEYHLPIKKFVYDYSGEMYHYQKDKTVDLLVSPEHKIWYRKVGHRKPSEWLLESANTIKENNIEFLIGANWEGKEEKMTILPEVEYLKQKKKNKGTIKIGMDTWLEFLGYVLSEGGMDVRGGFKGHYNLNIAQKDKEKAQKIRDCLVKLPFKFTEHKDKDNYFRFDIANKTLWIWLYQNIGAYCYEKRIPKEFKNLSKRQLKILFDAYMLGDGSIDKRVNRNCGNASSVSKKLVDDLQEIGLKLGYKSKVVERQDKRGGNRKVYWRISFTFDNSVKSGITPELRLKKDLKIEQYDGKIYCFEVPNHLFITRRNGLISIQGNTAATAIEKGVSEKGNMTLGEVERLVQKAGERIVSIAKFYRRAWKEFAQKWLKMTLVNFTTRKLSKRSPKGQYYEQTITLKDIEILKDANVVVRSSSEKEAEQTKTLQKIILIKAQIPNNKALQKIATKKMLETLNLTVDEMRQIEEEQKAMENAPPVITPGVEQPGGPPQGPQPEVAGLGQAANELSNMMK